MGSWLVVGKSGHSRMSDLPRTTRKSSTLALFWNRDQSLLSLETVVIGWIHYLSGPGYLRVLLEEMHGRVVCHAMLSWTMWAILSERQATLLLRSNLLASRG